MSLLLLVGCARPVADVGDHRFSSEASKGEADEERSGSGLASEPIEGSERRVGYSDGQRLGSPKEHKASAARKQAAREMVTLLKKISRESAEGKDVGPDWEYLRALSSHFQGEVGEADSSRSTLNDPRLLELAENFEADASMAMTFQQAFDPAGEKEWLSILMRLEDDLN